MKHLLFNPFERFSERPLILFGIATTIVLSLTSAFFNARFDGVLDLHFSRPTFFINTLTDNIINITILSIALFTLGKIRNSKTRFIDLFSASLIARIPYYFLAFFNWNDTVLRESEKLLQQFLTIQPETAPIFKEIQLLPLVLFSITSILFLAWYLYLLFQGYRVATNAKGAVEVVLFGVTILIAELFSKFIFYFIN